MRVGRKAARRSDGDAAVATTTMPASRATVRRRPADAGDGFSKKETEEFEDMMLVTFTEMERRKYNDKAAAEGRPQIPYTDAAPRTLKGKYAPDMIKAAKDRADYFAMAV